MSREKINGFARIQCPGCCHEYLLAFSCKHRHFCPSWRSHFGVGVKRRDRLRRGNPGKPGYMLLSGRPSSDGHLVLAGMVVAIAKRWRGEKFRMRYEGTYRDGLYELIGFHSTTRCTMTIRMDSHPLSGSDVDSKNANWVELAIPLVSESTHRLARAFFEFVHRNLCGSGGNRSG